LFARRWRELRGLFDRVEWNAPGFVDS
jgi:hypothetical protein